MVDIRGLITKFATSAGDVINDIEDAVPPPVENNTVDGIITFALSAVGAVSVGFIIYGGIQYSMSAGDPGKVATAKRTILYAVVGLAVALLAFAIVAFVQGAVG